MQGGRLIRVFLSSTYKDLVDHRAAVITALERLDVRVDAMELWAAKSEQPLDVSLVRARTCDVCVLLVGHRYGCLTDSGVSITEAEYSEARKAGRICLVFMISQDYPVLPRDIDSGIAAERLKRFKHLLLQNHTCTSFGSPADAAIKVTESVREQLVDSGDLAAKELDLTTFWKELRYDWEQVGIPDLQMEFDPTTGPLELVEQIRVVHAGIAGFHGHIQRSYSQLESDLRALMSRLGCDVGRLEEMHYSENPFINRDWEWIFLFPNRLTKLDVLVTQLEVKVLEQMLRFADAPSDAPSRLETAKSRLKELVRSSFYID